MNKKNHDITFSIESMTSLRYLIPILKYVVEINNKTNVGIYSKVSRKYNCPKRNLGLLSSILSEFVSKENINFYMLEENEFKNTEVNTRILFSLESTPFTDDGFVFKYDRKYCIQHGTDYWHFAKKADKKTTYIVSDDVYAEDIKNFNQEIDVVLSEVPTSFWRLEKEYSSLSSEISSFRKNKKNLMCLFYPEKGNHSIVAEVVKQFREEFFIFIKQRRKNQVPSSEVLKLSKDIGVIFDDVWYPSEAIALPAFCDISIGFGTSAYIDIVKSGYNFIDYPLHPETIKYPKPSFSEHFLKVNSFDEIVQGVKNFKKNNYKISVNNTFDELEFVRSLI